MPSTPSVTSSETVTVADGPSSSKDAPKLTAGDELSRYVVLDTLGRGGMGEVLRAYDPRLHREVALKRLRSGVLEPTAAERMVREAQAMAQLAHPNVVAVYDVERLASTVLLVMELVEGTTLAQWARTPRQWPEIVKVFVQAGRGLAAAHAAGLVHRDFKPANVLVGEDGRVRVTDFGLARPAAERASGSTRTSTSPTPSGSHPSLSSLSTTVTHAGMVMGTPAYMAPEQHLGQEADAKADQYSLCVALWEILTGERPFGGTYREVAVAKLEGPPAWPTGSAIPRRIADAIVRGLQAAPDDRWPSMDALLGVLDRDPARTRLRAVTIGAIGIATVATVGSLSGWWLEAPKCRGAAEHLVGVWDDERRDLVAAAIRGTGVEYAATTIDEVSRHLDGYAESWASAHTEACEATSVRGEQSTEALDLRMSCLRRRLHSLEAVVEVLTSADEAVVEDAIPLAVGLPSLEGCADVDALLSLVRPPSDPAVAEAVEHARQQLAHADASLDVGRIEDAAATMDAIPELARTHPPLAAELDLAQGRLALDLRRYDEAESRLDDAYLTALRSGHDVVAVEALAALAFTIGARRMREPESMWLIRTALALAEDIDDPELQGVVLNDMGGILQAFAHHAEATAHFERALELQRELFGESHPSVTTTMTNLAISLQEKGDLQGSFELRSRVLELERGIFGEPHPRVARLLHIIGNGLHQKGDYQASVDHLEQALRQRRSLLGKAHPETAHTLASLGLAQSALGRHAEAETNIREAFEILEHEVGVEHHEVIDTLTNLAIVVSAQGRHEESLALHRRTADALEAVLGLDHPHTAAALSNTAGELAKLRRYEEALPLLERAIDVMERTVGPEHPHVGVFVGNAGDALLGLGRLEEAEAHYRRALPIVEQAFGADHVYASYAAVGLGRALVARGSSDEALPLLERAMELRQQDGVSVADRAEAAFALAQALHASDPRRARRLARDAEALLADAGPGHALDLADIDAWLERTRSP